MSTYTTSTFPNTEKYSLGFLASCRIGIMFLKKDGFFFLVIKTRSIDVTKAPKRIVEEEIEKLREKFEILESIDLHPYDKDHAMVIAKYKN